MKGVYMKQFNCYLEKDNYLTLNKLSNYFCLSKSTIFTYALVLFNKDRKLNNSNYDDTTPFFLNENYSIKLKLKERDYACDIRCNFCLNSEVKSLLAYLSKEFDTTKTKIVNYVVYDYLKPLTYSFEKSPLGFKLLHVKEKNPNKFAMGRFQTRKVAL